MPRACDAVKCGRGTRGVRRGRKARNGGRSISSPSTSEEWRPDMARTWRVANGHLIAGADALGEKDGEKSGEKDGAAVAVLCDPRETSSRQLSRAQREVLSQLEHATMPFLERTSTGAAGLVVTASGHRRLASSSPPTNWCSLRMGTPAPPRSATLWRTGSRSRGRPGPSARSCASSCATTRLVSPACVTTSSAWRSRSSRVERVRTGAR